MHLSTESKSTNVMKQKPFLLFVSLSTKVSTFSTEPNWPKYWRISSSERSSLSPPTKSLLTFSSRSERGCLSFDVCNNQFGFKHFYHLASNSTAEESVRKDFAYLGNNALGVHLLSIQSVWSFWLQQINARGFVKCNKTESSRSTKPTNVFAKRVDVKTVRAGVMLEGQNIFIIMLGVNIDTHLLVCPSRMTMQSTMVPYLLKYSFIDSSVVSGWRPPMNTFLICSGSIPSELLFWLCILIFIPLQQKLYMVNN